MTSPQKCILVVGPSWVGDMVMAQSLFKTLHDKHPDVRLDVLAPGWSLPLLHRMPEVRKGFKVPAGHGQLAFKARLGLGRFLRAQQYAQAVVLPRSWKSALIPFWARVPVRTGFTGEFRYFLINDIRRLDPEILKTTVERFTALGCPNHAPMPPKINYPRLTVDHNQGLVLLRKWGLDSKQPIAGFMPGAEYGPAKQWPLSHFAELARCLSDDGWRVCIFGSHKDSQIGEEITHLSGDRAINMCGRTSLEDAVDLLAQTKVAVTNDSGLMHIAAAVGTRVVAVFGSSSPGYTPPLTPYATVLTADIECRPCFQRRCRFGHYRCLTEIDVQKVISAIRVLCPL